MTRTEFNLPNYDIEVLKRRVMGLHSFLERIQLVFMNGEKATTSEKFHNWILARKMKLKLRNKETKTKKVHEWIENFYLPIG